jgi:hypothetical protein
MRCSALVARHTRYHDEGNAVDSEDAAYRTCTASFQDAVALHQTFLQLRDELRVLEGIDTSGQDEDIRDSLSWLHALAVFSGFFLILFGLSGNDRNTTYSAQLQSIKLVVYNVDAPS